MLIVQKQQMETYTRIDNRALYDSDLTDREFRFYSRLAGLGRGNKGFKAASKAELARLAGVSPSTLSGLSKKLQNKGYLDVSDGDWYLTCPNAVTLAEHAHVEESDKCLEIAQELEEQPNRPKGKLTADERWELIKEAWNKHKPESYQELKGRKNLPAFIAVETQSKHLGVDRDDYDAFIGTVLKGCQVTEWWSKKSLKLTNVFGFGKDLDTKKFQNVKTLFEAGKAKGGAFDWSDSAVLKWFNGIIPGWTSVERLTFSEESFDLAYDHEINTRTESSGKIYLYYVEGRQKPRWWTNKTDRKFQASPDSQ